MARAGRLLLIVALLFGAGTTASSCSSSCQSLGAPPAATFVGSLRAVHSSSATFGVEKWTKSLRRASTVDVHYPESKIRFLHVGRHYSVAVWVENNDLFSDIHTADGCSGYGTSYADGSAIDTSLWSRSVVRNSVIGFVVGVVALFLLLVWWTRGRHRRRRQRQLSQA